MKKNSSLHAYQQEFKNFLIENDISIREFLKADVTTPKEYSASNQEEFVGSRLSIYRNNVFHSLSEALGNLYPVTRRIVGDDCFLAVAKKYVSAHPPQDPVLTFYGQVFAKFIAQSESCQHLQYLEDVAQLEWHCQCSLHAADAQIFDPASLSRMDEESLSNLTFSLHPSAVLMQSKFPVDQIWAENQKAEVGAVNIKQNEQCDLLIYRKEMQIQVVNLQPTVYYLLESLAAGETISDAWEQAQQKAGEQAIKDEEFSNILVYLLGLSVFECYPERK